MCGGARHRSGGCCRRGRAWRLVCAVDPSPGVPAHARARRPARRRADAVVLLLPATAPATSVTPPRSRHRARPEPPKSTAVRRARRSPRRASTTAGLYGDDMLLVSAETIPADVVDRSGDRGRAASRRSPRPSRCRIGQFSAENKMLRRRRRRPRRLPDLHPARQRRSSRTSGTGSRPARSPSTESLEKRLPLDKDGYLPSASGEQDVPIHVGAYVDQVGTVDAVVNTAWGEASGWSRTTRS